MTEAAQTTVGVVRESGADERRVALVPKAVTGLVGSGVAVVVESGAGERALLPDGLYTAAGAAQRRQPDRRAAGGGGSGVRGRGDPADLAGAGDGRAVVAGQRGGLQGGAAGGVGVDTVLSDADHRGGHGETGHAAGARCRGG